MARLTRADERTSPKLVDVAFVSAVRVVHLCGRLNHLTLKAPFAQWVLSQLGLAQLAPASRAVQLPVSRSLGATLVASVSHSAGRLVRPSLQCAWCFLSRLVTALHRAGGPALPLSNAEAAGGGPRQGVYATEVAMLLLLAATTNAPHTLGMGGKMSAALLKRG